MQFFLQVIDCRLVVEPRTRISRGFDFVTMDNLEDADRCIKYMNQSILEGRFITVEKVKCLHAIFNLTCHGKWLFIGVI